MSYSTVEWAGKARRFLPASIGERTLPSKLCPCHLDQNTRSKAAFADKFGLFGLWLSLVERLVRDQEAVGSNPTSPIQSMRQV